MDPLIGQTIYGKFEIIELIGSGGWSVVYRARHRNLNRIVAFKVLRSDLVSTAEKIQRFEKEAKLASSINHPNICAVYDYGILSSGQPYLVLEYLSGKNFAAIISDDELLPVDRVVSLMKDVTAALDAAHTQGIIHRDLKPGNLMVVDENGKQTVKVIDFGLAKTFGADAVKDLTQTGLTIGTPAYMSPEQVQGLPLDARSDIYAFGCVFYELLTGKQAVSGKTIFETMQNQLEYEPVFPETNSRVPDALKTLTLDCLRKDIRRRYQSMREIAEDLDSFTRTGKSRRGRRVLGRLLREKRMHMAGSLVVGVIAVLSVLALTFAVAGPRHAVPDNGAIEARLSKIESSLPDADVQMATEETMRIVAELKAAGQGRSPEMARAAKLAQQLLNQSDRRAQTVPYILLAFEAQKSALPPMSQQYLDLHKETALAMQEVDQLQSVPYLRKWLALTEKKFGAQHKEVVLPLGALSWALFKGGLNEEAEKSYLRHLALTRKFYGAKDNELVTDYGAMAWLYCNMQQYEKARTAGQKGISLLSDSISPGSQQDLYWTTALAEQKCHNYAVAEKLFRKALAISLRSDAAEANEIMGALGHCLYEAGKYSEAEPVLREALPKVAKSMGTKTAVYKLCLDDYVQLLRRTKRGREADAIEARGSI